MAAKHRRRKDARPGEILAAALTAFATRGFAATRLEDIAARAGISKGTIYLYFDGKESLFRALLKQAAGAHLGALEALVDAYDGPADRLLRTLLAQAGRQLVTSDLRHLLRLLIAEGPRFPDLLAFHHAEVIGRGRVLLARVIRYGIERGEFRDNDLERFPQILVAGPMLALIWQGLFDRFEPLDVERYLGVLADTLLDGLVVR